MQTQTNQNHYDVLQVSYGASQEAIEKMFRFMAAQEHPDAGGDKKVFNQIVEAFEVLRDEKSRAAYDRELNLETQEISRLKENSKQAGPDAALRHEMLCLFYARRREQTESPTLGEVAIEKALKLEAGTLGFHLWYFKEKGWIVRGENGGFAITAAGVDQIDATEMRIAGQLRIAATPETQYGSLVAV